MSNAAGSAAKEKTGHWVEVELLDKAGKPVPNEKYRVTAPDGTESEGYLDSQGRARVDGIDLGNCKITFPELDKKSWRKK